MAPLNPRIASLIDGLVAPKRPVMAPADATARVNEPSAGVGYALRAALRKLDEFRQANQQQTAEAFDPKILGTPRGNDAILNVLMGATTGPKAPRVGNPADLVSALKRSGPFDAAHQLAMGKLRALEGAPHEMPDLLPALAREGSAKRGIEAWHGSPYRGISAFDAEKIGTRRGAQSHGRGLYFAENPDVAKSYLTGKDFHIDGEPVDPLKGALYRVEIDATLDDLLDWDKPLGQQSPAVQRAVRGTPLQDADPSRPLGDRISEVMRNEGDPTSDLSGRGVRGIRYADAGSRPSPVQLEGGQWRLKGSKTNEIFDTEDNARRWGEQHATSNYVVFDPKHIKILKMLAAAGVTSAANELAAMRQQQAKK